MTREPGTGRRFLTKDETWLFRSLSERKIDKSLL